MEPARNLRLGNDRFSILVQAYFSTGYIGGEIQTVGRLHTFIGAVRLTHTKGVQRTVRNIHTMIVYPGLRMHS
jgi:hypothetical protein